MKILVVFLVSTRCWTSHRRVDLVPVDTYANFLESTLPRFFLESRSIVVFVTEMSQIFKGNKLVFKNTVI